MSTISATMVKELREKTGAGIMDCKGALAECDGDMSKAVDFLRKKGLATAAKRAGRSMTEGIIEFYIHMTTSSGFWLKLIVRPILLQKMTISRNLQKTLRCTLPPPILLGSALKTFLKRPSTGKRKSIGARYWKWANLKK